MGDEAPEPPPIREPFNGWPANNRPPPPPSGFRLPLPSTDLVGSPVHVGPNGTNPIFVGSAIFENSVHPCKIDFSLYPPCRVAWSGADASHYGSYELLPITPQMEWVPTRNGEIPPDRRPVEGGYESSGEKLYHALARIKDIDVPGKVGKHLGCACVPYDGREHAIVEYRILCWR